MSTLRVPLDSLNLAAAERQLIDVALRTADTLGEAADLLGITRHALKRRIVKHGLTWPRDPGARQI